jgi:hypothetical protein
MTSEPAPSVRLTCQDVIGLMLDYLETALDEARLAAFEHHLEGCAPCTAYLNTYRKTTALAAEVERVPIPDEMRQRLRSFLLAQLRDDQDSR